MVICISTYISTILQWVFFSSGVFNQNKVSLFVNSSWTDDGSFLYRWLGIPSTKNPKELQSFWACQMKSRQKKSSRTFLSKAKSVSSHATNLTAITWTCWSCHQLKTWLHSLWRLGIFFSLVMVTTQERKLLLAVSNFVVHHRVVEQEQPGGK